MGLFDFFEDVPTPKDLLNKLPDFEDVSFKIKIDQFEDVPFNIFGKGGGK